VQTDEPLFVGVNYRMPELSAAILRPQLRRLDAQLESRRRRREYVVSKLSQPGARFSVSPHNDVASAVGLSVIFEDVERAKAFSGAKGVVRLIETGRHVYTNWESVLGRRSAHPKLDPYAWVGRADPITAETCPKTLDILARTCSVQLLPEIPMPAYRLVVRRMVNASRA
jgi:dTDP-4-amino-4,6-dideoxygalactose transaminase